MQEYDSKNTCPVCGQTLIFHSVAGKEWETCPDGHEQPAQDSESRYLEAVARADNAEQTEW